MYFAKYARLFAFILSVLLLGSKDQSSLMAYEDQSFAYPSYATNQPMPQQGWEGGNIAQMGAPNETWRNIGIPYAQPTYTDPYGAGNYGYPSQYVTSNQGNFGNGAGMRNNSQIYYGDTSISADDPFVGYSNGRVYRLNTPDVMPSVVQNGLSQQPLMVQQGFSQPPVHGFNQAPAPQVHQDTWTASKRSPGMWGAN